MVAWVVVWEQDLAAGSLPPICALTGRPTSAMRRVRYVSTPGWIGWLILFGFLPFFIAWACTRRAASGQLPLSPMAQRWLSRFGWKVLGTCVGSLVVIGVAVWLTVTVAPAAAPVAATLAVAMFFVLIVVGNRWYRRNVIEGYVGEWTPWGRMVTLYNVDPTFAAAVRQMYASRQPELLPAR